MSNITLKTDALTNQAAIANDYAKNLEYWKKRNTRNSVFSRMGRSSYLISMGMAPHSTTQLVAIQPVITTSATWVGINPMTAKC